MEDTGEAQADTYGAAPAVQPPRTSNTGDDSIEFRLELLALILLAVAGVMLWHETTKGLLHQIAPNLVAAAIVGLVVLAAYGRLLRKRDKELIRQQTRLLEHAANEVERTREENSQKDDQISKMVSMLVDSEPRLEAAKQLGIVRVFRHRPTEVINPAMLDARDDVSILEISLNTMRDINADEWRGCTARNVRLILLDPLYPTSAPLALQRDREEHPEFAGQILSEVHELLHKLPGEWFDLATGEERVKLAQTMPTLSYFRIDSKAYFSPLVHRQVGDVTLHLELEEGGQFFGILAKHFDALWNDADRVKPAQINDVPKKYPYPI
jgi:hypothetical protein